MLAAADRKDLLHDGIAQNEAWNGISGSEGLKSGKLSGKLHRQIGHRKLGICIQALNDRVLAQMLSRISVDPIAEGFEHPSRDAESRCKLVPSEFHKRVPDRHERRGEIEALDAPS